MNTVEFDALVLKLAEAIGLSNACREILDGYKADYERCVAKVDSIRAELLALTPANTESRTRSYERPAPDPEYGNLSQKVIDILADNPKGISAKDAAELLPQFKYRNVYATMNNLVNRHLAARVAYGLFAPAAVKHSEPVSTSEPPEVE